MESLCKPLNPAATKPVKLFARNSDVNFLNHINLHDHDKGEVVNYRSADEGDPNLLHNCQAPRTLSLKVGSPVILIRNIDDIFVNGLKGEVMECRADGPLIRFGDHMMQVRKLNLYTILQRAWF